MTPKEKAVAMVYKYSNLINYDFVSDLNFHDPSDENRNRRVTKDAKLCALASLEDIVEQNNVWISLVGRGTNNYWKEVKKEIQNL
jgi:hypothetical protein